MFCPTCGINNSLERKYCNCCGTNLEAVSQAIAESADGFFTKMDIALDRLIARYAEHIFNDAPKNALDRRVSKSWQVLGQGLLTIIIDNLLFTLMFILIPI